MAYAEVTRDLRRGLRREGRRAGGDDYQPKRFFSLLTDEEIRDAASRVFDLVDFRRIPLGPDGWAYQALVLTR